MAAVRSDWLKAYPGREKGGKGKEGGRGKDGPSWGTIGRLKAADGG